MKKEFMFVLLCLFENSFAEVLLEGTDNSLLLETATSGFDESASGRFG